MGKNYTCLFNRLQYTYMPLPRLNIHKQTVIYNGLKFWNVLPDNLKNKPSFNCFKMHLKRSFS